MHSRGDLASEFLNIEVAINVLVTSSTPFMNCQSAKLLTEVPFSKKGDDGQTAIDIGLKHILKSLLN